MKLCLLLYLYYVGKSILLLSLDLTTTWQFCKIL